jgi:hypothetical protein
VVSILRQEIKRGADQKDLPSNKMFVSTTDIGSVTYWFPEYF